MQTISLDIHQKEPVAVVQVKQGDVGRKFKAVITKNGEPYVIPADAKVSVWYSGASGEGNYSKIDGTNALIVEDNSITVELIAQMVSHSGGGTMCILLNNQDGAQLGLWNIPYFAEHVPGLNSPAAEAYFSAFSELIHDATTDKTLSVLGKPADGKSVGDALAKKADMPVVVSGERVVIEDSREAPLCNLILRGKTIQDGTPTPDTPVKIVGAGAEGSITVTVNDDMQQTLTIDVPNGLYEGDYIDFARGVRVQGSKELVLTGSEDYRLYTISAYGIKQIWLMLNGYKKPISSAYKIGAYCNQYTEISANAAYTGAREGIAFDYTSNSVRFYDADITNAMTDISEWVAYVKGLYDAGTPIIIRYPLATPIETPLTEEELAQYAAMHTNAPATSIQNDAGAQMEVTYYLPQATLPAAGGTMHGDVNMGLRRITGLGSPVGQTDAVPYGVFLRAIQEKTDYTADGGQVGTLEELSEIVIQHLKMMPHPASLRIAVGCDMDDIYGNTLVTIHRGDGIDGTHEATAMMVCSNGNLLVGYTYDDSLEGRWQSMTWEFINPPMFAGVEYRTTERYDGSAVYVMLVEIGTMPNAATKRINTGIESMVDLVSISYTYKSTAGTTIASFAADTQAYMSYYQQAWWMEVKATGDLSGYTGKAVIKYTKE